MDVNVLNDPVIKKIAADKRKSPAQIILAWHVQRKCIPLAKTTKDERLLENISATYDVKLTSAEVKKIDDLDCWIRLFNPKFYNDPVGWHDMPYYE